MRQFHTFLLAFLLVAGCTSNLSEPTGFDPDKFPAAPEDIKVAIGDRTVGLSWSHPKPSEVASYNIYRWIGEDTTEVARIASSSKPTYTDSTLKNGQTYFYQISAVNAEGLEGKKSKAVSAIPDIFGIVINFGDAFANHKTVTVSVTAPSGTRFMMLSNDSSFTAAQWEAFGAQRSWTLSDEDGLKTVYAKFRDEEDREIIHPVSDDIILDTEATIREVTEDTGGQIKSGGESIHFTLDAGETNGKASIDIENGPSNIILFDDGRDGDSTPGDGIYEKIYSIPEGSNIFNASIFGRFTDRAGNVADRLQAATRININSPPSAVTLFEPQAQGSSTSIRLAWTRNSDGDFSRYEIHRKDSPFVFLSSPLVKAIDDQETVVFTDSDLLPNTTYHYRVFVFDKFGLNSQSNEASGTTLPDEPPQAVALAKPTQIDSSTFRLTWSKSQEADFESYRIFRSESSPVDTTAAPVGIINGDANTTTFEDTGLKENVTYFYRVFVYDMFGSRTGSNEVNGNISN